MKILQRSWVWRCEAIGRKPNYFRSLTFGPMRHIDDIASRALAVSVLIEQSMIYKSSQI